MCNLETKKLAKFSGVYFQIMKPKNYLRIIPPAPIFIQLPPPIFSHCVYIQHFIAKILYYIYFSICIIWFKNRYYYLVWDFIITSSFFQKFYFSFWFWRITVYLPQIFYCLGNEKKPPATSFLRKEYNIAIFFGLCNFNSSFLFDLDWNDNHWEKSWVSFLFFLIMMVGLNYLLLIDKSLSRH